MDEDIDYEEIRRRNIAENEALLASLDLKGASDALGIVAAKPEKGKTPKKSEARPVQPRRRSERVRMEVSPAPRRQSPRLSNLRASPRRTDPKRKRQEELGAKRERDEEERLAALELVRVSKRPRHGNLSLDDLVDDEDGKGSIISLRATLDVACKEIRFAESSPRSSRKREEKFELPNTDPRIDDLRKRLSRMVVRSRAKVTQDRVYSMACHPEKTKDLIFVGDKHGQLGIWDALAPPEEGEDDEDIDPDSGEGGRYWRLQPHWPKSARSSISCVKLSPTDAHSVLTTSYDCTLRMTSFTSGQSTELFSLASTSTLLTSFDIGPNGNEIWISDAEGGLSFLDIRESSRSRRQVNPKLKIGCVSINPAPGRSHLLCTASNDHFLKIWDTRKLMLIETGTPIEGDDDGSSSLEVKPPTILEADNEIVTNFLSSKPGQGCILGQFEHKQSASAAFWDCRGERIVSTSYDNNLRIWNLIPWLSSRTKLAPTSPLKPTHQKAHNCLTGRWVTLLKAQWSQNLDEPAHFTVGSMSHSLDIIAYNGEEIVKLADASKVSAVQAVTASHPSIAERAISGNASGRCVLWGPP